MAESNSDNLKQAQKPVPCDVCEEEIPGTYYCIDCKKTLCEECEKFHKKFTSDHNVVLRSMVGDIDGSILRCTDHDKKATFHCEVCNIPVCGKCVTGEHQGHKMADLDETIQRKKEMLQSDVDEIKKDILPTLLHQKEKINTEKESYKQTCENIRKEIESENEGFIEKISQVHNERLENLSRTMGDSMTIFDKRSEETESKIYLSEDVLSKYVAAIEKDSFSSIMQLAKQRVSLAEMKYESKLPKPPTHLPLNLRDVLSSSLLTPALQATPAIISKFDSPFKKSASICITKEGDVWLGGIDSRELVMVDIKGQVLKKNTLQNRVNGFAVMDNGDFIISPISVDSRLVRRRLADGKEQTMLDTSPSSSYGVSVTADQKILICLKDGRVVVVNSDGTNIRQIYKGSDDDTAVHAVESADGDIYIGDRNNSKVLLVNRDGQIMLSLKATRNGEKLKCLTGLVFDKLGNILCADKDNNSVYIIDQKNLMRPLVGRSHGIKNPRWLAVDNENNLWITQYDGTVQVAKYLSY